MKKEIETLNKNQEGIKNKILEIKNTLEGITTRLDEAEERISELEDKVERNNQVEQLHKKRLKSNRNQDGGVGRHTAPPRTTKTDRKSNGKGVPHQGNTK